MRIIDIHTHTGKWLVHNRTGDDDIPRMLDKFNIEKAVFSSSLSLMDDLSEGNDMNYSVIMKDDRCFGYITVNQNRLSESVRQLSKYIGKPKIVGIKMHPEQYEHPVNSAESRELLKIINSYGLPVLIHTAHSEVCRPKHVLEIAREYDKNKYIIAHMGNAWWKEAIATAAASENIYTDIISSWCAFDQIKRACDVLGPEKVLYGSDLTVLDPSISIGMVLSSEISEEDREKIFYKNALKIFSFN